MAIKEKFKKVPGWLWKVFGGIGTVAGVILSVSQLSDYYWEKAETLVKGSVTQSAIMITTELKKTEQRIGGFLIDGIQFRIIGIQDEMAIYTRQGKTPPPYLNRQLELLKDQLGEAKGKWEE